MRAVISRRHLLALSLLAACAEDKGAGNTSGKGNGEKKVATVRVSAIPDENPTELLRKFQPLVDFLKKSLGAEVEYIPVTDYGAAVQALASDKVDFAWLGAFTFVQASHQAKVEPLCMREVDRNFKSVFIASAESGITAISDLKGKTFAFGSKSSTSGHLMPRHFLTTEHGLDPEKDFERTTFSGSHDATIKMVESGQMQAGAANSLVWQRMLKEGKVDKDKVNVVWTTPGYVDYVWAARTAVPQKLRDKFKAAFLGLKPGEGDAVLKLQDAKRFVAASQDDFKAVEKVALDAGLLKPAK